MNRNKAILAAAMLLDEIEEDEDRNQRSVWARQFWFRGASNPYFEKLMTDLQSEGEDFFRSFAHISLSEFEEICHQVENRVKKQNTSLRVAISVEERVALTLKYLAFGDSIKTISQLFRISPQSIYSIVPEVCQALYDCLKDEYLKV